jgi:hypothetical protein
VDKGTLMTDTLPPAEIDRRLFFTLAAGGPGAREGVCRLRLYRTGGGEAVIVCSDVPQRLRNGSMDPSEYVWPRAWAEVGHPWPCTFVEHRAGRPQRRPDSEFGEHLLSLVFPQGLDERPVERYEPGTHPVLRFGAARRELLALSDFHALVERPAGDSGGLADDM